MNPNLLSETEMVELLRSGEHHALLNAYFGQTAYRELRRLALTPAPPPTARVYLLPGFMGSRLMKGAGAASRLLWLNPAELIAGELRQLALPSRSRTGVFGAMLPGYLKLKLTLENAGFDVGVFSYDWRGSIAKLGEALARAIDADPAKEVMLIAHSMGGLVARAALKHPAGAKVSRVVQLGTPNQGSFALVQALRAVYPTVLKLAALDRRHTAIELARQVFGTLPSVYEMLPRHELSASMNFFDPKNWPRDRLRPNSKLLARAQRLPECLAQADSRCHSIVGVGHPTNVGVERDGAALVYRFSRSGDGTVASASAAWSGAKLWFAAVAHGDLIKNTAVCGAVVDILKKHTTRRLRSTPPARRFVSRRRPESALRAALPCKAQWEHLPAEERRRLLEPQISAAFRASCKRSDKRKN